MLMPLNYEKIVENATNTLGIMDVFLWVCILAIVFGGVVPFIPQYIEIRKTEDTDGFSMFGKYYEYPLLFQSIVMIVTMMMMIHLCVLIRSRSPLERDHKFTDFEMKFFWKWTDFNSYLEFVLLFFFIGGVVTYAFARYQVYVESVGTLAVMVEAMLGVPQLHQNFHNKSTLGMSTKMVVMWFLGDFFKTSYFLARKSPIQFWLCGFVQMLVDLCILCQVWIYKNISSIRRRRTLEFES